MAEETTGQQSQADQGQQSQADNSKDSSQSGQEPKTFDEAYVKQLRQEAAGHRKRATDAEAELQKIKDAQLSETERAKKEAADAQAKAQKLEADYKAAIVRAEIAVLGTGLKIVDADAAYRLIDQAAIQFDDQGKPTNVKALLDQLVKDKPYLVAQGGPTTPPNNPGRSGTTLTKEQIEKMTPAQINANWDEVQKVLAAG